MQALVDIHNMIMSHRFFLFALFIIIPAFVDAEDVCPFHLMSGDVTATSAYIQSSLRSPSCRPDPTSLSAKVKVRVSAFRNLSNPILESNVSVFAYAGIDPREFPGAYIAKVILENLNPNTPYYYRFVDQLGNKSPVGSMRTLPVTNVPVHFLHMSCANVNPYPVAGALYRFIRDEKPQFNIFNGDTVYSDRYWLPANFTAFNKVQKCCQFPIPSIDYFRSLYEDQRDRDYAGEGFPAALRLIPTFMTWDDHAVYDNYAGSSNNVLSIVDSLPKGSEITEVERVPPHTIEALFKSGYQAFFEFNSVKPGYVLQTEDFVPGLTHPERRIFRKFSAGPDVDVFILDLRQYRDAPVPANGTLPILPKGLPPTFFCDGPNADPVLCAIFEGPIFNQDSIREANKTLMGHPQKEWLKAGLKNSTAKFKIIVSSVMMLEMFITPSDRWEGYWKEREEIINFIESENITGVNVLVGDIHASIFSRINPGREPAIHEFTTGSIGGGTLGISLGDLSVLFAQFVTTFGANGHLLPQGAEPVIKFANLDTSNFMSVMIENKKMVVRCIGPDGKVVVDKFGNRGEYIVH